MYIAVCDDQTEELGSLTELIGAWEEDRGTPVRVKSFRSAAALLDAARHERFTLYLLDIMMPGLNGMDAAREIRGFDKAADIIFLTSSPGFAYDSYSVKALEYLLKPIRIELLEDNMRELNSLTASVGKLATSIESMVKEQEKQGRRLETLEDRDGAMWRKIVAYGATALIGIFIGYIAQQLGMN